MTAPRVLFIGGTGVISTACIHRAVEQGFDVTAAQPGHDHGPPDPARGPGADGRRPRRRRRAGGAGGQEFDVGRRLPGLHPRPRAGRPRPVRAAGSGSTSSSARRRPTRPRRPGCRSSSRRRCATRTGSTRGTRSPARTCSPRPTARTASRPRSSGRRTPTTTRRSRSTAAGPPIDRMRRGAPGRRARRRHLAVDPHPPHRLRRAVRRPARPTRGRSVTPSTSPPTRRCRGTRSPRPWPRRRASSRGSCTCRRTRSRRPTRSGAPACSATRRTRWSSTTARSRRSCPGWVATVPFAQGAREIVDWHDADPSRRVVDAGLDATMDRLAEAYVRAPGRQLMADQAARRAMRP